MILRPFDFLKVKGITVMFSSLNGKNTENASKEIIISSATDARACSDEIESILHRHARACRGHPRLSYGASASKTWMAGIGLAMTPEKWFDIIGIRSSRLSENESIGAFKRELCFVEAGYAPNSNLFREFITGSEPIFRHGVYVGYQGIRIGSARVCP
jgi:hypothetical protein